MTSADQSPHPPAVSAASWGQGRRLEFIDFRLRWEGRINRSDLTAFFGISVPQASLDIAKYLDMSPANATYDRRGRFYVSTSDFTPLFPSSSPERYLGELLVRSTGVLQAELSFLGWSPAVGVAAGPARTVRADILSRVLAAIRGKRVLSIRYQSMSSIEPALRHIEPHALAYDGFRWHVRAYCRTREAFLDFVIARMLSVETTELLGRSGTEDDEWACMVPIVIEPDPALSEARRRVVELDYEMKDGAATFKCRQALLFYVLRRLDLLDQYRSQPNARHVILKNRDEIEHLLPGRLRLS